MRLSLDRAAERTLADEAAVARHDASVFLVRVVRDLACSKLPDYEALRERAAAIKRHTLDHLDHYLVEFETRAREAGAVVHWAPDAAEANATVEGLLRERGVQRVVKSKSMLTEECGLNPHLERAGIEVVDTDLGERIMQLAGQPPSHIVAPAIHMRRAEIGALFHRTLGAPAGEEDPPRLAELARADLRPRFLAAEAGITGVNFAIAETGSVVVCTNEGNADLGMTLPPLHIACLGIEKLVPTLDDVGVFLRLLARSATGQPITAYTTFVTGPRPGGELHIVLVDNGRTGLLATETHRSALACIRCGACLNTCPVYRRAGGHAYGTPIPGPIGSVLAPALGLGAHPRELPLASTLCGSCTEVCPVRIDLHAQLLAWRREAPALSRGMRLAGRLASAMLARPRLYRAGGRLARLVWPLLSRAFPGNPASGWLRERALPPHPGPSLRERWARREPVRP